MPRCRKVSGTLTIACWSSTFVAPQSDVERQIASVWEELLNLEQVGVRDNFFDLGANSLLMVQANNILRQRVSPDLSLVSMFRFPTVAALAEHLSSGNDRAAGQEHDRSEQRGQQRRASQENRNRRQALRGRAGEQSDRGRSG